jgi:dTDP-glucose 4,6-dehydratase
VGGPDECENIEVVKRILELTGRDESLIEYVADRKGHDRRYSLDITKIREELGYAPQISIEDGLAATVTWYRDNRDWWEPLKARTSG